MLLCALVTGSTVRGVLICVYAVRQIDALVGVHCATERQRLERHPTGHEHVTAPSIRTEKKMRKKGRPAGPTGLGEGEGIRKISLQMVNVEVSSDIEAADAHTEDPLKARAVANEETPKETQFGQGDIASSPFNEGRKDETDNGAVEDVAPEVILLDIQSATEQLKRSDKESVEVGTGPNNENQEQKDETPDGDEKYWQQGGNHEVSDGDGDPDITSSFGNCFYNGQLLPDGLLILDILFCLRPLSALRGYRGVFLHRVLDRRFGTAGPSATSGTHGPSVFSVPHVPPRSTQG